MKEAIQTCVTITQRLSSVSIFFTFSLPHLAQLKHFSGGKRAIT